MKDGRVAVLAIAFAALPHFLYLFDVLPFNAAVLMGLSIIGSYLAILAFDPDA